MKVVIWNRYGGFRLSTKEHTFYEALAGHPFGSEEIDYDRTNPLLVKTVEAVGNGDLAIVEIPDDVKWHIEEYDGAEWIAEDHRTWGTNM